MSPEHVEIPRATGYRILHDQGSSNDPVLVLTTAVGDHHFVLSQGLCRMLAASCAQAAGESK